MEQNLINDIKNAEKRASEIVSAARDDAELSLTKLEEEHKRKIEELGINFKQRKGEMLKKAKLDASVLAEEKRSEAMKIIKQIQENGNKKKDEVIDFILKKIME